ncbi:MAG: hypothetical protein IJ982_01865, partial [Fibrobacter sp.]|nr:hypothetical protein [Fibrobacter sp.]
MAKQPPCIAVNAGHLHVQAAVRKFLQQPLLHFGTQFLHWLVKMLLIFFLLGHKPGPLIVEADAPH